VWEFGSDRERRDGYDEVEWAAAQPWSNGSVGLFGDSYRGINQWWTAMEQPPHLKAIMPIDPPADMYRTGGVNGGELSTLVLAQGLVVVFGIPPGNTAASDPRAAAQVAAAHPFGALLAGEGTVDIVDGGAQSYDSAYYHARGGYWNADRITVPTFIVGGWYDIAQRDAPLMFEELQKRGVPVKLVMGPWYHTNYGAGLPAAGLPFTVDDLALRWFGHYLAGDPDPTLAEFGPVVYQSQGEAGYRSATSWPPADVQPAPLYLAGSAVPGQPAALQTAAPTGAAAGDMLPWHPVSGACSRSASQALLGLPTAYFSTPCDANGALNDLTGLAYDLPASTTERRFAGPVAAHLYLSTTGTDAFVDVRLEDVAPDGTVSALSDGIETLSLRALDPDRTLSVGGLVLRPFHPYTKASQAAVERGVVYDWWVEILPTAATIAPGHVLRITVQPSDAGQSVMAADRLAGMAGSMMTILHDADHPSAVNVPFLPG